MKSEREVREELSRLFPEESNEARVGEWQALVDQGLIAAAERKDRMWQIEASLSRKYPHRQGDLNQKVPPKEAEQEANSATNYTELTDSPTPSGIKVQGSTYIGKIESENDVIALEAVEFVDIDAKLAIYNLQVTVAKDSRQYSSNIRYDEIDQLLIAIEAMKRASTGVTQFASFQVIWTGHSGFSIRVFNDNNGKIRGAIEGNGALVLLHTSQALNDFQRLVKDAKSYIDCNLQRVGNVDFLLIEEDRRTQTEFLSQLPDLIVERTTPYLKVLSTKFLQLTYVDDYGTPEYGSFYSEIDRYISKIFPELKDIHRGLAKDFIVGMVKKFTVDHENGSCEFDPDMGALEYERHCAKAFSQAGWSTNMTQKTGDQGADVVIKHKDMTGVVQCKLYSQPVGNAAVQEVIAAREYYQASIAVVVSNAAYTTAARQLAAIANVVLLHHEEIAAHSLKLGVEPLVEPVAER